ncbi:MAG: prepilin-type N-terminal cleavage/methylation domain-containing protein [Saccharospirillaceae bacterium]|nr:prepilin-type N-terminal cleavage/methylation domain-containing protein [Saccharospirillaceae bacterium]
MPFLPRSRQQGFTLIELLIVIVVGSILAIISVRFISESSRMLLDSGARQQLAATGSVISEKISRLLRPALPGSIRTTADGRCIEFIPVNVASVYTDLELNAPISGFSAVPVSETQTNSGYAVIYPISQNELYNPSARGALTQAVATLPARTAGTAAVTVSLSSAHEFLSDSPVRRFYLVGTPEAVCQQGNYLYHFRHYGFIANVASLEAALPASQAAGRDVLAYPLQNNSLNFRYLPPTLQRNGLVTFSYVLDNLSGNDQLQQTQEVQIRNVP